MRWTDEMVDALEAAMNVGETRVVLADRYGVSERAIYAVARATKDKDPTRFPTLLSKVELGYHEWSDADVVRLEREWRLGVTGQNIASSFGISLNTLRQKIDAERRKDKRAGRPTRFPKRQRDRNTGRMARLWLTMPDDLYMKARRMARRKNMTLTAYVRALVVRDAA